MLIKNHTLWFAYNVEVNKNEKKVSNIINEFCTYNCKNENFIFKNITNDNEMMIMSNKSKNISNKSVTMMITEQWKLMKIKLLIMMRTEIQ